MLLYNFQVHVLFSDFKTFIKLLNGEEGVTLAHVYFMCLTHIHDILHFLQIWLNDFYEGWPGWNTHGPLQML